MGVFKNFVFKDGKIVDNNWLKWVHFGVPDEEGKDRDTIRDHFETLGHCKPCTSLSGCYFVKSGLPEKKAEGDGLLHPHCDCTLNGIPKPDGEVTATCPIEKFTGYIFSDKEEHVSNGKIELFKALGFRKEDSEYLKTQYDTQARQKYLNGDYTIGKLDEHGQRIKISIVVDSSTRKNIEFITGWMVHPLGKIMCSTPFAGR